MSYYTCILCRTQGHERPWVGTFDPEMALGGCPRCYLTQGILPLGDCDSADLTDAMEVIRLGLVDRYDDEEVDGGMS